MPRRLLVAVGGNAIHPAGIKGTTEEQVAFTAATGRALLPLLETDNELVITHGNGPGVGKVLMRQALARHRVAPMSLDICVANSQGGIAYLLMQAFENALREVGNPRHVMCMLTQVEVDPDDPAFDHPTKPVGYFYSEEEASDLSVELGWQMHEDAGRGWRLVVPSPIPRHIVDISLIDAVAKQGSVVIAGGGGGIPVVRGINGVRHGIEAVIDKDLTSAHMANVLGIETHRNHDDLDRCVSRRHQLRQAPAARTRASLGINHACVSGRRSIFEGQHGTESRGRHSLHRRGRPAGHHRAP
jgi:carbamate kinase